MCNKQSSANLQIITYRGVGRSPEVVRPTKVAHAQKSYRGVILQGNLDHGSIPPKSFKCTVVTKSYCAVEVVLLLSYVAYVTKGPAMLPLGDNVSESWENDVFLAIWIHLRLYITQ